MTILANTFSNFVMYIETNIFVIINIVVVGVVVGVVVVGVVNAIVVYI